MILQETNLAYIFVHNPCRGPWIWGWFTRNHNTKQFKRWQERNKSPHTGQREIQFTNANALWSRALVCTVGFQATVLYANQSGESRQSNERRTNQHSEIRLRSLPTESVMQSAGKYGTAPSAKWKNVLNARWNIRLFKHGKTLEFKMHWSFIAIPIRFREAKLLLVFALRFGGIVVTGLLVRKENNQSMLSSVHLAPGVPASENVRNV